MVQGKTTSPLYFDLDMSPYMPENGTPQYTEAAVAAAYSVGVTPAELMQNGHGTLTEEEVLEGWKWCTKTVKLGLLHLLGIEYSDGLGVGPGRGSGTYAPPSFRRAPPGLKE